MKPFRRSTAKGDSSFIHKIAGVAAATTPPTLDNKGDMDMMTTTMPDNVRRWRILEGADGSGCNLSFLLVVCKHLSAPRTFLHAPNIIIISFLLGPVIIILLYRSVTTHCWPARPPPIRIHWQDVFEMAANKFRIDEAKNSELRGFNETRGGH